LVLLKKIYKFHNVEVLDIDLLSLKKNLVHSYLYI
jgi:hypothetical protein